MTLPVSGEPEQTDEVSLDDLAAPPSLLLVKLNAAHQALSDARAAAVRELAQTVIDVIDDYTYGPAARLEGDPR